MALEFGEGTFEQVPRREEAELELKPLLAAPIEVRTPKIAMKSELNAFLGQIEPYQVVLKNDVWTFVKAEKDYSATPRFGYII